MDSGRFTCSSMNDQGSFKAVTDELMDSGRCSFMTDQGSVMDSRRSSLMTDQGSVMDSRRSSFMTDQGSAMDSRRSSLMTDQGSVLDSRRSSFMTDQGSAMDSQRSSLMSDKGSVKTVTDELMDSGRCSSMTKQGSIKTMRGEPQTRIKEEPHSYVKSEQKTPFKDNKQITVSIRGQGSQTKPLLINRTASLDEFTSEANCLFGFGREPGNTYIVHNGKQLSRGTQTIEQAGLRDNSNVELLVRTLGG